MITVTSLPTALFEEPRQIEWCCLLLEHLNEFATLAWYFVADRQLVEWVSRRTLKSLDGIPFDTSQPLLTYNKARDMIITQAIEALTVIRGMLQRGEDS
ncbi:MAG: hypothetical protein WA869_13385 [Alloacidobacterium sp.]